MILKNGHLISCTNNHTVPTNTHQKATCCTLTLPDMLQTVPRPAHTMGYRLKINGVTSIELNCENFLNTQFKKNLTT